VAAYVFYHSEFGDLSPLSGVGSGGDYFDTLMWINFWAVYLLQPAFMVGTITAEKERDTLVLVLMTDIKPWELLLQKYLGRVLPMLVFLTLSLPLIAITYGLGGVDIDYLMVSVLLLIATCFQIGAWALICSCLFRTTAAAFIAAYLSYGLWIGWFILLNDWGFREKIIFSILGVYHFDVWNPGTHGLVVLPASTLVFLLIARIFLLRRAFVKPRNLMLEAFVRADVFFTRLNDRMGGITFGQNRGERVLADEQPVLWRETVKKTLNSPHYMARNHILLLAPTLFLVIGMLPGGVYDSDDIAYRIWMLAFWGLSMLVLCVKGVNLFAAEKAHQTLTVLLTTPISGAAIIQEKFQGIRRFTTLLVPSFVVSLLGATVTMDREPGSFLGALLSFWVYTKLTCWLALFLGLKMKQRTRALFTTIGILVAWCVIPFAVLFLLEEFGNGFGEPYLGLLSPLSVILAMERETTLFPHPLFVAMLINAGLYFGITQLLKRYVLKHADRLLGRTQLTTRSIS
jgi:ABC-type transport system involved in multi-copper enzyme maturation permease subunit